VSLDDALPRLPEGRRIQVAFDHVVARFDVEDFGRRRQLAREDFLLRGRQLVDVFNVFHSHVGGCSSLG
jgi:hypothetical protein